MEDYPKQEAGTLQVVSKTLEALEADRFCLVN